MDDVKDTAAAKNETKVDQKEEFPFIDYDNLLPKLPLDKDGFVVEFDIIMDDDHKLQSQNKQEIQDFFHKYGVVVIRNTLTDAAMTKTMNETMDFVELWHPRFKRNDSETWSKVDGVSKRLGIIGDVCLSKQVALNRCNPKIYKAYQYILGDTDIYTNVGRVSYMRPTKGIKIGNEIVNRPEWKSAEGSKWLHTDYDPLTNHCTTYGFNATQYHQTSAKDTYPKVRTQGIVALADCALENGGFECVPGFHKIEKQWIEVNGAESVQKRIYQHRYQFSENDPLIAYITKCAIRAGSLLVWNCKLPHNNFPNNSDKPRMVQYIRYTRRDDPAVTFVNFGVENTGPWGKWNTHLVNLDVTNEELGELGRKVYRVSEHPQIPAQQQNDRLYDAVSKTCHIM